MIEVVAGQPAALMPAALSAKAALAKYAQRDWSVVAARRSSDTSDIVLSVDPAMPHAEAYRLVIDDRAVRVTGASPRAVFYGVQTLVQLLRQCGPKLPALRIDDHPDFAARGVMLDISRDKVPTMATLYALVDQLAEWKINQFQLYMEHTFAYRAHPDVWSQASPLTGEEILRLDAYCRERYIELVPNQNSFGHMERWLNLPRYKHLAEAPNGSRLPWGSWWDGPAGLCPIDPGSLDLLKGLYDELLPHFTSGLFNVGCDETFDLGQGRSKEVCEQRGKHRVYVDFLLKIYEQVRDRGRTMQFWGDIILHEPELIRELPRDVIALQWGYTAGHPFDRDGHHFAAAGLPFYVCPGTSSWQSFAARTDNALANLKSAAESGLKHGAIGYLNTDWGDLGHHQYLSASYLGLAAGAAFGWCLATNRDLDLVAALDAHVFEDRAGVMARLAYDLGNVYKLAGAVRHACSPLFRVIVPVPGEPIDPPQQITLEQFDAVQAEIERIMASLDQAHMQRPDAGLIADEFRNAARLLTHACRRGRRHYRPESEPDAELASDLRHCIGEHRRLWLARNRIGGLSESSGRLEQALADYTASASSS